MKGQFFISYRWIFDAKWGFGFLYMESQLWTSNFFHCSHLYPTNVTFINITDLYAYFEKKIYLKASLHQMLFHSRFFSFFSPFSLRFSFFSLFYLRFGYQHVGIQNTSENTRKTRENLVCVLYYTMHWVKPRASRVVSHVFSNV